ncbi:MAG: hypothetical protein M3R53_06950 [Candidatus Eremiobacteraeota bacterium]|nr:hypothetical protein [Candidatus Eremiobacteraeota bacterium]
MRALAVLALACAAGLPSAALAQSAPVAAAPLPVLPVLPAPPLPTGPLGRSLSGAYGAIVRAGATDPAAAQRAEFLYADARQRALRGDTSGALASANAAQAAALSRQPVFVTPAETNVLAAGTVPRESPALAGGASAALPADLLVARNEIELGDRLHAGSSLESAKRRYRRALDAYLSGDAANAHREARAAFDLAADVLSRLK